MSAVSRIDIISNDMPLDLKVSETNSLTRDIALIILLSLKTELQNVALVCKNWKAFADNRTFRDRIYPSQAFGATEWKEYLSAHAEKEPLLPRRAYGDMEAGDYLLTFIPKNLKVPTTGGKVRRVRINNLAAIANLVKKPKKGNEIGLSCDSGWNGDCKNIIGLEKPHWVLIDKEAVGKNKTYQQQQMEAEKSQVKISGLIDTVISLFMEYVRSGKCHLERGQNEPSLRLRLNEYVKHDQKHFVRWVKQVNGKDCYCKLRFKLCFYHKDSIRSQDYLNIFWGDEETAHVNVAFAAAQVNFGI